MRKWNGQKLKIARRKRLLKQRKLEKKMNVAKGLVSKWESGKEPSLGNQEQLAEILGTNDFFKEVKE